MLGTTAAALAPLLTELMVSDLVHHAERSRSDFMFRHALIQEATYLALLRAERRDLHARAARAIEAAASGRLPEVAAIIGRHYATAENAERAVHYLELAGDHATDAFANDEAVLSFRAALAVEDRASAGTASDSSGDLLAAAVRRTPSWPTCCGGRHAGRKPDRSPRGARPRRRRYPRPPGPGWDLRRAHLRTRLGRLEMSDSRYEAAAAAFDAAEVLLGTDAGRVDTTNAAAADQWLELMIDGRASLHLWCSRPDLARAVLEQARPILEARGRPASETAFHRVWTMQKLLLTRLRVDEEDIANLRAGVAAAEHTGEDRDKDVGYATDYLGWALWLRGDLAAAAEELTKALTLAERIGETILRDLALSSLTLTALRRHDTQAVRALLPRAFEATRLARNLTAISQAPCPPRPGSPGRTAVRTRSRGWPPRSSLLTWRTPVQARCTGGFTRSR